MNHAHTSLRNELNTSSRPASANSVSFNSSLSEYARFWMESDIHGEVTRCRKFVVTYGRYEQRILRNALDLIYQNKSVTSPPTPVSVVWPNNKERFNVISGRGHKSQIPLEHDNVKAMPEIDWANLNYD